MTCELLHAPDMLIGVGCALAPYRYASHTLTWKNQGQDRTLQCMAQWETDGNDHDRHIHPQGVARTGVSVQKRTDKPWQEHVLGLLVPPGSEPSDTPDLQG